ncbi:MAG TPA: ATP-binding cassette domain-containing protein [Pseudomonadales bacterium]
MIQLQAISLRRGGHQLLNNSNLTIHPGWHMAIVGNNGCGKSSLFALLTQQLSQDEGEFNIPGTWVIAHMEQEVTALSRPAIEYVLDGDKALRKIQTELAEIELSHQQGTMTKHASEKLAHLHHEMELAEGYTAKARAGKMLSGLGFAPADLIRPVSDFSGGWRMRLNLAHTLMCRSDLLLLDEPTNHLDLDALLWLEKWLKTYPGTLVLISHDREFLDATVGHIVHIENSTLNYYRGNYSAFEVQRTEQMAQQQSAYEKQQREIAHIQSFITRFKAKASKARQAQSRVKAMEKLETIAAAHIDSPFNFSFRSPEKLPNPLLKLSKATLGYDSNPILSKVNLTLEPGSRLGILGPNGAGKSTLIKSLAQKLALLQGECQSSPHLKSGYFAQHQLEHLDINASALQHLARIAEKETETTLRTFLGSFGFHNDKVTETITNFSGGEKARLALALIVWQKPNLLLLDEPTNHLDIDMRHALAMALQSFEGAVILVSHDRHLIRCATEELCLVAEGKVQTFSGSLDDYEKWLMDFRKQQDQPSTDKPQSTDAEASKNNRKEERKNSAEQRKLLRPIAIKLQKLETNMEQLSSQQTKLNAQLADSRIYDNENKAELRNLLQTQTELKQAFDACEHEWMILSEELESLESKICD